MLFMSIFLGFSKLWARIFIFPVTDSFLETAGNEPKAHQKNDQKRGKNDLENMANRKQLF